MKQLSRLRFAEDVNLEPGALSLLHNGVDVDESHDVIECAVVKVAEFMGAVEQALIHEDIEALQKAARALGALGDKFGFLVVAKVAQDVIACAQDRNFPALYAVTERLIRVGDASLAAAIERALPS